MLRSALFAAAVALVAASSANAMGPRIESYGVEGYLDRAPEGTEVIDEIAFRHGETQRTLYVTAVAGSGTVEVCPSCDGLFDANATFTVGGDEAIVERLIAMPEGGKIAALLTRPRTDRQVIVERLEVDSGDTVASDRDLDTRS